MSEPVVNELVQRMQGAASEQEAERARWQLEAALLPNQVLRQGCGDMVTAVFDGLSSSSPGGLLESWEVLSQVAAATSGESAADGATVSRVRDVLVQNAAAALSRIADQEPRAYDLLAVDVIDALLSFADPALKERCLDALRIFQLRGPRETARVGVILKDVSGPRST